MEALNLVEDICPVSDFRKDITKFISKVAGSQKPIVLTQRGRSTAVLLDVNEYQNMINRLSVIDELDASKRRYERGEFLTSQQAKERLLGKYKDV
jgi:prevent-host-death family protein